MMGNGIAKKCKEVVGKFEIRSKIRSIWTGLENMVYGNREKERERSKRASLKD